MLRLLITCLLCLTTLPALAQTANSPFAEALSPATSTLLSNDEAFDLDVISVTPEEVVITLHVEPGHYLYRDEFSFTPAPGLVIGEPLMPEGIDKTDEFFGDHQAYYDGVTIAIPVEMVNIPQVDLTVGYQGCAEIGVCYPPTEKTLTLDFEIGECTLIDDAPCQDAVSEQARISNILSDQHFIWALIIFFGLGLLLAFTPCVLPMLPILSGIILGQQQPLTRLRAFELSLIYVIAVSVTFAIAGVIAAMLGASLQASLQQPWLLSLTAAILVVLAMMLLADYSFSLPRSWQNKIDGFSRNQKSGTVLGVAAMGVLSALVVSPCVTPPLIGALIYIAESGDPLLGGLALLMLGLGMGVPLILFAVFGAQLLPKQGAWMVTIKNAFAALLILLALTVLERFLPGTLMLALWGVFAIIIAVCLGAFEAAASLVARIKKGIAWILLVYGSVMLIGASMGNCDWQKPLASLNQTTVAVGATDHQICPDNGPCYTPVKTLEDFETELANARELGKPVLLDFYADWCTTCLTLARDVFPDPEVQRLLRNAVYLKADVTANDCDDKALQRHFNVFGPPSVHFFDHDGNEQPGFQIVGDISAPNFVTHLEQWLATH